MLSGTRENLINVLKPILGEAKAQSTIADFETMVRNQAEAGTNAAINGKIPEIKKAVEDKAGSLVKPLFRGAMIAGGVGGLLAIIALARSRRCRAK